MISVYHARIFKMWCGFCSLSIIWIKFIIWSKNIMKSICVPASGTLILVQCPKSRQNSVKPWFEKHGAMRTLLSSFREFTNDVKQMVTDHHWCGRVVDHVSKASLLKVCKRCANDVNSIFENPDVENLPMMKMFVNAVVSSHRISTYRMRGWWRIRGPDFYLINLPFWILRT